MAGRLTVRRTLLLLGLAALTLPIWAAERESKIETLTGKVVSLAEELDKAGTKLDPDAAPFWLALRTESGKLYPLVKDSGSRLFFNDKALLNRPMRLTGRFISGSTLFRVTSVNSLQKGELYEIYYWCDICSIKRGEKMICECCGGPMELKEEPVKP